MSQRRMTEVSSPPEYASTTRRTLRVVTVASEQVDDHRLLHVQPVLRLVEHDRADLGEAHDRVVDLIAAEGLQPLLALGLLPHAHPDVGIDDVGPAGRL